MLLLVFLGIFTSSCTGLFGWKNYEGSEQFRDDVAVFADFAVKKQFITLYYLKATSDGYTRDILKGTVSSEEYDVFFGTVAQMAPYIKEYESALKNLEKSGILTSVNTKGIESIVIAAHSLETGSAPETGDSCNNTDDQGTCRSGKTGRRCNRNQSGDGTRHGP